jgi:thioredoxin reductase (NADPH)
MVRSIFLRGFDQDMANRIGAYMEKTGTKMIRSSTPTKCEKLSNGRLKVTYKGREEGAKEQTMEVDTLLMAVGRVPETKWLGVDKLGMKLHKWSGKILTATNEQTSIPNIYAIGDVAQDKLELTPVAIQAGRLLSQRLFGRGQEIMNYHKVATTVFTPLEYGAIGFSEEDAIKTFGEDKIEVYHATFRPLEMFVAERLEDDCYVKLVVDKSRNELVVGFHILGPHAGEVTQGFAIAMRKNAVKSDFDLTVGIHPTVAEELTTLDITKSSGKSSKTEGC